MKDNIGYYSYKKNNWKEGDRVTSQRLNHIQEGIANTGIKFIHGIIIENYHIELPINFNDIISYIYSGILPFLILEIDTEDSSSDGIISGADIYPLSQIGAYNGVYRVVFDGPVSTFTARNPYLLLSSQQR